QKAGGAVCNSGDSGRIKIEANDVDGSVGEILFKGNKALSSSAGAINSAGVSLEIYGNKITFEKNTSTNLDADGNPVMSENELTVGSYGGAVFANSGVNKFVAETVIFTDNHANAIGEDLPGVDDYRSYRFGGGAIQVRGMETPTTVTLGKAGGTNLFEKNTSAMHGGAILSRSTAEGEIAETTINGKTTFKGNHAVPTEYVVDGQTNTTAGNGGAIANVAVGGGTTVMTINGDAEFRNNKATAGKGGAIYNEVIEVETTDDQGNAIVVGTATDASMTITGKSTFAKNTATEGGAIYNNGALSINGDGVKLFSQNTATAGNGGAIYMNTGDLAFTGNTIFTSNSATGVGGAIYMNGGDMSFDGNNVFTANTTGGDGAAIYNNGGALTMKGTSNVFSGNTTQGDGGAIRNNKGTVSVTNGQFVANTALGSESYGGAIYHSPGKVVDENGNVITSTVLNIKDSVFKDNISTDAGGAIGEGPGNYDATHAQTAISGTLFDGNHTGDAGGALALFRNVTDQGQHDANETDEDFANRVTQITNTTFTNNTAGVEVKDANGNTVLAENLNGTGGGAIFIGGGVKLEMNDVSFINNESLTQGGAIATRQVYYTPSSSRPYYMTAFMNITNGVFVGNKAGTRGGAISDYLHSNGK
ncbi:MAG: hypothetical protein J6U64_05405, partial [Alphaproteobacteria bacterium]|nr:hypothetical protein [Alphaproteobacteria bacterium]